jgi:ATP:ADP antiporter, AAA family
MLAVNHDTPRQTPPGASISADSRTALTREILGFGCARRRRRSRLLLHGGTERDTVHLLMSSLARRALDHLIVLREGEGRGVLLMFAYSFLAMTSYNIVKPITRSKFITSFGADNLPWILLGAGFLIALLMHQYAHTMGKLPRRSVLPVTLVGIIGLQVLFWALLQTGWEAVSVGLFLFGQIVGILLISQFWTLANDIYDARQARRVFGFIGGGASLGGATGAAITRFLVTEVGTTNLLLVSAVALALCLGIVTLVLRRADENRLSAIQDERGVGGAEALRMLSQSPHLRILGLVICLAAGGATIVEQQVNMVAEATRQDEDAITAFLANITIYISLAGFFVQVVLTSRIHRSLGLAFALLLLPLTLGSTAAIILITGMTWAPQVARVVDSTLRYTVDKTTREILFLPLPADLKYRAKPFIDVTMDRFAKALAAVALLFLVQPWALNLDWREISYASLGVVAIWIGATVIARREYLRSFRNSIGTMAIAPDAMRAGSADAATVETLVEELSKPDEASVLYAITMLEALDKRNLITPLLLQHDSPRVRTRVLVALTATRSRIAREWTPAIARMVQDEHVDVRAAALRALAVLGHEDVSVLMGRHLEDPEPRVAVAAATALADSGDPDDSGRADAALRRMIGDVRDAAVFGRIESANALAHIHNPGFRPLLVPLLYDHDARVVQAAIRSARVLGAADGLFIPGLLSLLGHRTLKTDARDTLIGYGETVVLALDHALRDHREHIWLRRHIPNTLALIPTQASMDALVASLGEPDGFLRYKAIAAIERLTREHPEIQFPRPVVEKLLVTETSRYYNWLTLHYNLLQHSAGAPHTLLGRALNDKMTRALDRIYRLLGLLYHVDDIAAARYTIEHGESRRRAQAIEYLDNLLGGIVRRRVLPILDDTPLSDKVRHANGLLRSRPRELDDTLAQLIHDDDPVVAAAAIHFVAHHQRWALADDLDYVLSHADDVAVIEAADWALARARRSMSSTFALRATGEKHDGGSLPAVELADRVAAIPLFQFVSVDELFRIAEVGEQIRYAAGRDVFRGGSGSADVQFVLDGTAVRGGAEITPPAVLGLEEVLAGAPPPAGVQAVEPLGCFRIGGGDFLTMLADNVLLAQGLFRMLLARGSERADRGLSPRLPELAPRETTSATFDTAMMLRHHPLFERATAPQLLALTGAAVEVPLTAGTRLFGAGDMPAVFIVLSGELVLQSAAVGPVRAAEGAALGVTETLAGSEWTSTALVERAGRALRLDREALFDVLGDEVELMQSLFSGVLRMNASRPVEMP